MIRLIIKIFIFTSLTFTNTIAEEYIYWGSFFGAVNSTGVSNGGVSYDCTGAPSPGVHFSREIYKYNTETETTSLIKAFTTGACGTPNDNVQFGDNSYVESSSGNIHLEQSDGTFKIYSSSNGTLISTQPNISVSGYTNLGSGKLGTNQIVDTEGNQIIARSNTGEIHIGENSLVTIESGGRQQLYATDATGTRIDINIPSGTRLLIDGEDVMGSIDSSIALGAAFASLPTGAEGAGYTCGLGTGFHDSASAISGGCGFDFANYSFVDSMPELFQKASFNIGAASVVHGEGDDATLKAGITFKFGAPKPVRQARDDNLLLENKIDAVMAENDLLKAQIAEINTQLKALNILAMN